MPRPLRRALAAGLTTALALGGVVTLGVAPANAGTASWSDTLQPGDPERDATYGCQPIPLLEGQQPYVTAYDTQQFSVTQAGEYSITMTEMSTGDLDYHLFAGAYDPADPLAGCIAYNDDRGSLRPGLTVPLEAGATYTLLVGHLYGNGRGTTVAHTNVFDGPGDIVLASAPTVTIDQASTQVDPATAAPVRFDVVFSEPVAGFDAADVVVEGTAGGSDVVVTGSGATYVVEVGAVANDGTVEVAIGPAAATSIATGAASARATSTDAVVTVATRPSVVVAQAAGQADPTDALPVEFEVRFSQPVTGLEPADVTLSGTAGSTTVELVALDAPPASPEPTDPEPTISPEPSLPPVDAPAASYELVVPAAEGEPLPDPDASASQYLVRVLDAAQAGTIEVAIAEGAATTELGATSLASTSEDATVTFVVAAPSPSPAPSETGTTPSAPAPTTASPSAAPAADGTLPQTGASPLWILLAGAAALMLAGLGARRVARTR